MFLIIEGVASILSIYIHKKDFFNRPLELLDQIGQLPAQGSYKPLKNGAHEKIQTPDSLIRRQHMNVSYLY